MKIPGLSFSWKRALGITKAKRRFTKKTGIPTTQAGLERKIGRVILDFFFGSSTEKKTSKKKTVKRKSR